MKQTQPITSQPQTLISLLDTEDRPQPPYPAVNSLLAKIVAAHQQAQVHERLTAVLKRMKATPSKLTKRDLLNLRADILAKAEQSQFLSKAHQALFALGVEVLGDYPLTDYIALADGVWKPGRF